jgi:hypothetical protein
LEEKREIKAIGHPDHLAGAAVVLYYDDDYLF